MAIKLSSTPVPFPSVFHSWSHRWPRLTAVLAGVVYAASMALLAIVAMGVAAHALYKLCESQRPSHSGSESKAPLLEGDYAGAKGSINF